MCVTVLPHRINISTLTLPHISPPLLSFDGPLFLSLHREPRLGPVEKYILFCILQNYEIFISAAAHVFQCVLGVTLSDPGSIVQPIIFYLFWLYCRHHSVNMREKTEGVKCYYGIFIIHEFTFITLSQMKLDWFGLLSVMESMT